jgi:hypothetical protein
MIIEKICNFKSKDLTCGRQQMRKYHFQTQVDGMKSKLLLRGHVDVGKRDCAILSEGFLRGSVFDAEQKSARIEYRQSISCRLRRYSNHRDHRFSHELLDEKPGANDLEKESPPRFN